MKDIVVIRPFLVAYIYMQCPLCETANYIEKSENFYSGAQIRCEGCGANIDMELLAIQDARFLINTDDLKDDDVTALMGKNDKNLILSQDNLVISNPVQKIIVEKSAFYFAFVKCPFCQEDVIVRYVKGGEPYPAQWCPECGAEMVVTIIVHGAIGGEVSEWYEPIIEEFYNPEDNKE